MAAPGVAAPGAPALGTAGFLTVNGQRVHVNTAGIIDTPGAGYGKYPEQVIQARQTALPPTQPSNPNAPSASQDLNAQGIVESILAPYGLQGLSQWALNLYAQSGSWDYVKSQIPTTPQFQARFPAWQTWSSQGHTVAQYVDYENTITQAAHAAGFPQGAVNQNTITNWINNGVSAAEGTQRIQAAQIATTQLDKASQHYLAWNEMGLTDGDLAAVFFDPNTALPVLQNKLNAAVIGGAAANAGINLDTGLATDLAKQGITQDQARQGFAHMANDQQLFQPLPGQTGNTFTQGQQVGAELGTDAGAQKALATARSNRLAPFQAGGGFATSSQGVIGAGKAIGA